MTWQLILLISMACLRNIAVLGPCNSSLLWLLIIIVLILIFILDYHLVHHSTAVWAPGDTPLYGRNDNWTVKWNITWHLLTSGNLGTGLPWHLLALAPGNLYSHLVNNIFIFIFFIIIIITWSHCCRGTLLHWVLGTWSKDEIMTNDWQILRNFWRCLLWFIY